MAAFDYVALDRKGRRQKGVIEADSLRQSRQFLRERALTPLDVHETSHARRTDPKPGLRRRRVGLRDVSIITRQLAVLIESGLPVEQALQVLIRQSESSRIKSMLAAIRAQVLEGQSLSESLGAFPDSFPEMYRSSVKAGEQTGHLDKVLSNLADFAENAFQARQKILLAMLYPAILTVVSLLIMLFLMACIMPDMQRVFSGSGHALPLLTQGFIALGKGLQQYGLFLPLAMALSIMAARSALRRPQVRLALDKSKRRWPVIGPLVRQYDASRFASVLGMLQESGVPLVQALEIGGAVTTNSYVRLEVQHIARQVREGASLSRSLEQSSVFPPMFATMAGSGEASGELGTMLNRAAAIQQRSLETRVAVILGVFEPLLLLVMAGLVLLLVLAIIRPILNLNQLVQ